MSLCLAIVLASGAFKVQDVPRRVYLTHALQAEETRFDTKDKSQWNHVRRDGFDIFMAKSLDNFAAPQAVIALIQFAKGQPAGTYLTSTNSDANTILALREALLKSPFAAGPAGEVGRSVNPKGFLVPTASVEVQVGDRTINLRARQMPDGAILNMSPVDLKPHEEAKKFERRWMNQSDDLVTRRLEFHMEGPFFGMEMFEATALASKELVTRLERLREEHARNMAKEVESIFGDAGWTSKNRVDQMPEPFRKLLEETTRSRYQELGFKDADQAWAAVQGGKLNVKKLGLSVMVQKDRHVQSFALDSIFP